MIRQWTLMAVLALTFAGCNCGPGGATAASCNAGWSNYCNKIFTCSAETTAFAQQAFQSEANCTALLSTSCAAVQFYAGACATQYSACVSSLQSLTCGNLTGSSNFDQPSACDNTGC